MANKGMTWDMVAKRLASVAAQTVTGRRRPPHSRPNFAMITATVIVDQNGSPVGWLKPTGQRLEPSGDWVTATPFCQEIDED